GSILAQSFQDFELILMNDGSTDGTGDIGRRFAENDSRIKYYEHANSGLVQTLNRGLTLASSPIVARMDADDLALPHRLSRQVKFLQAHQDIVLVGAGIIECTSDMQPMRELKLPTQPDQIRRHLMTLGNAFAHPTVMFRKQTVIDYGGYNSF